MRPLQPELERRRAAHLYRHRRVLESAQGPLLQVDGEALLSFCSNDYLGLANHPEVVRAMQRGAERYGAGSGSAHLVAGHSAVHHALEEELAEFTGRPRALLYSTGYMANQGVITALLGRGDSVYQDRLNHASLIDGGLLSRAELKRYPHNDLAALAGRMACQRGGDALVAVDGVFSMDGDTAPLAQLAEICRQRPAWLMVDDAHGFGVLGPTGAGTVEAAGLGEAEVPVLMATLGKALGTSGAFIAGSELLVEALIQSTRNYIYTTAMPPALAAASLTALTLLREEAWRRDHLATLIGQFRRGAEALQLPLMDSGSAIQPLLVGEARAAVRISEALRQRGILVGAIRPPTVPPNTSRLRITLSAAHTPAQLEQLLQTLADCWPHA
jgi:8-amino-7-oxononanoate synthase